MAVFVDPWVTRSTATLMSLDVNCPGFALGVSTKTPSEVRPRLLYVNFFADRTRPVDAFRKVMLGFFTITSEVAIPHPES